MAVDDRFEPIGRSGNWALVSWNVPVKPIREILETTLHKSGSPMTLKSLKQAVLADRPDAAEKSVVAYLTSLPEFTRVGPSLYALTSWRLQSASPSTRGSRLSEDQFHSLVKSAFGKSSKLPLVDLVRHLLEHSDRKEAGIRLRLKRTPYVRIERKAGARKQTVHFVDEDAPELTGGGKGALKDKISAAILQVLAENPGRPFKKGELFEHVKRHVDCGRPYFYQLLSKVDGVFHYREGPDYMVAVDSPKQTTAPLSDPDSVARDMPTVWQRIHKLELTLRSIVRQEFDKRWPHSADKQIEKILGSDAWSKIQRNKEKYLQRYGDKGSSANEVLDFCYLKQLIELMTHSNAWQLFQTAFENRTTPLELSKSITPVRNDGAHFRKVTERELARCDTAVHDLMRGVEKLKTTG